MLERALLPVNSAEAFSFLADGSLDPLNGSLDLSALFQLEAQPAESDGYQSTPSLTPSWPDSHSDGFASATQTPDLNFSALPDRVLDGSDGAATAALWALFGLPQQAYESSAQELAEGNSLTAAKESAVQAAEDENDSGRFDIYQVLQRQQAARLSESEASAGAHEGGHGASPARPSAEPTPTQSRRAPLTRARSSDEDESDFSARAFAKRGRMTGPSSAGTASSGGVSGQADTAKRASRVAHTTAGASTSAQPTNVSAATLNSAVARPSKPMEECNASRVIKVYAGRRALYIGQTANTILAQGTVSQLPPRKYLRAAHREVLRSIRQNLVTKRRATIADPDYYACTECETDYGLKDVPIMKRRKAAHTLAYHKNRMCSACGLLVNGRELKQSREHRQMCPIWRALVAKGLYKDWLRARGFYDKGSTREFWMAKQVRQARQQAGAAGKPALFVQYLEQELEAAEVQALQTAIQAQAQSSQPSPTRDATGNSKQEDTASTDCNLNGPGNQAYDSAPYPEDGQGAQYDPSLQTYAATWQLWNPQPEAGPSQGFAGPSAPNTMAPPPAQYPDARGLEGYQFDGRMLPYQGVPLQGAGVLDAGDQAGGAAGPKVVMTRARPTPLSTANHGPA
ncbi:hypothetical protein AURDEDRAFT_159251 [Auricularia subglabra TFB-10046 SS5]|nr:hypothetical protein AURDEDRAFT_159251 [Auricularia subglabra TFB-10046 SS5]